MTEQAQVTATPVPPPTQPAAAPETVVTPPAAPAAVETAKEVPPEQDPKFAAKFAALSKREQGIRTREESIKAREAQFKAWEEEMKLADENPLSFLEKRKWTFDKLTQLALNDGKKPPEMRIQELEQKLEREAKEKAEREAKEAETSLETKRKAFLESAKGFLEQNKEKYELTANEDEGPELIHNVMWANWEQHQKRLTFDEAAAMVEKHFEDLIDNKYAKLNKVQARFKPKDPAADPAKPAPTSAPTLTNSQSATVPTPSEAKVMSVEESKAKAAQLLRWT